jgi:hypothetical protein
MSEEKISQLDMVFWLYEKIDDLERQFTKPGHGICCTCQTCGLNHDDCVCLDLKYFRQLHEMAGEKK